MRFAVAVCVLMLFVAGGCSKFAGEWLEEGTVNRSGEFMKATGPRRMALRFEPIATVRAGAYIDAAGVVDGQVVTSDTYLTMDHGNVAQFGSMIARIDGEKIMT